MRKKTLLLMVLIISLITVGSMTVSAADEIRVFVNGSRLAMDVPPRIISGRTMVPVRAVSEAVDCAVDWYSDTRQVVVWLDLEGHKPLLTMTIDDPDVTLYRYDDRTGMTGESVTIESPPIIVDGRTLVPLRFIAEAIGFTVNWDEVTKTVNLFSEGAAPEKLITAGEARAILKAWVDSHPFQLGSELRSGSDEHIVGGVEYYRFYLSIIKLGAAEILVSKATGEIFHLDSPYSSVGFVPVDDWYNKDHSEQSSNQHGALLTGGEAEARRVAQTWLNDHPELAIFLRDYNCEMFTHEGEIYYRFFNDQKYWLEILVHSKSGKLLCRQIEDGEYPGPPIIEPLEDYYNRYYG